MEFFKVMKCPYCEAENAKNARFCSKCGKPLRVVCPSCGQEQPVGAKFCSKCGTALNVENTPSEQDKKSRTWARRPGDFAQRFDISDMKGFFKKFTVEQGERAIFLEGGVYKGALSAGVYSFGTILSQFLIKDRACLILTDAGDVPLFFQIPNLKTKNSVLVSASGKATIRIRDFRAFLENYLKDREYVSFTDIEVRFAEELAQVAQDTLIHYSVEELAGNPKLVAELEENFKKAINEKFEETGLEILNIACVGFDEKAWKDVTKMRENMAVEIGIARANFERKATIRSLETADAVDEIESKGAVANAAQEVTHRLDDNELDHTLGQDSRVFSHEQGKRKQEFEEDLYEISQLKKLQLEGKKQRLEIERENERLTLENRSNASVEALISILGGDDPAAKQIAKLELEKRAASLTTEQILAIQSVESPAAAEALKAKYSAEEQKEFNKRTEEMYRENTEN
ncbi:MAG: zinc ribbon domain-containing protein, partial [Prevotellaceae bacterium]|nr:zinc ribbon domain-containing protein [Prevotellaceae bacterium]